MDPDHHFRYPITAFYSNQSILSMEVKQGWLIRYAHLEVIIYAIVVQPSRHGIYTSFTSLDKFLGWSEECSTPSRLRGNRCEHLSFNYSSSTQVGIPRLYLIVKVTLYRTLSVTLPCVFLFCPNSLRILD